MNNTVIKKVTAASGPDMVRETAKCEKGRAKTQRLLSYVFLHGEKRVFLVHRGSAPAV